MEKSALMLQAGDQMDATWTSALQAGCTRLHSLKGYLLHTHIVQIGLANGQQETQQEEWQNPQNYFPCQFHAELVNSHSQRKLMTASVVAGLKGLTGLPELSLY